MDDKGRGWFTEVIRAGANHLSRHNTIYRVLPMNGSISHALEDSAGAMVGDFRRIRAT